MLWRWTRKIILSEIIDFITNGEDSSNVGSDEEDDIVILPPTERADAETDCDSDTLPLAQQTLSNKILMKAIKLVIMNHASHFLRDRNKRRKKKNREKMTLTVLMILLIQKNYQQNYQTP